jgi:hypothetical protein
MGNPYPPCIYILLQKKNKILIIECSKLWSCLFQIWRLKTF